MARKFLCSAGSIFRDGGGQLPFAEHAGISDDLKRLGLRRRRKSTQHDQQKECSHDVLPCLSPRASQRFFRNARASATSVRVLSAPPAIATTLA